MIVPLTLACLLQASNYYHLDPNILESVRIAEAGHVGKATRNSDGSYDLGPFQINTSWVGRFRKMHHPIDPIKIRDNGCVNAYYAAYILKREIAEAHGNVLVGVGHYHSRDPFEARRYRKRVFRILQNLLRHHFLKRAKEAQNIQVASQ